MSLKVDRGRTRARSQAVQLLFQAEARDVPLDEVLEGDYLLSKGPLEEYAGVLARGTYECLDVIDRALAQVLENWSLPRLPGTDRNLLRIAVYEMRFADERIEDAVVIDEAVEIAKAYGTDESSRFVNGVLGRVARSDESLFAEPAAYTADANALEVPVAEEAPVESEAVEAPAEVVAAEGLEA